MFETTKAMATIGLGSGGHRADWTDDAVCTKVRDHTNDRIALEYARAALLLAQARRLEEWR